MERNAREMIGGRRCYYNCNCWSILGWLKDTVAVEGATQRLLWRGTTTRHTEIPMHTYTAADWSVFCIKHSLEELETRAYSLQTSHEEWKKMNCFECLMDYSVVRWRSVLYLEWNGNKIASNLSQSNECASTALPCDRFNATRLHKYDLLIRSP